MVFPNIAKGLQIACIALGISTNAQQVCAEISGDIRGLLEYQNTVIDTGEKKCFPDIDLSKYLQDYTVATGDTLGSIAEKNGFQIEHLINYWTEIYPGKDPNNLKIGESIKIFTPNYLEAYLQTETILSAKQSYEKILATWEQGDIEYLQNNFSYSITPERPISQGYDSVMSTLGSIWMSDIRSNAPANVDSRFIHEAVCAHQARRWDKFSINPNDINVPLSFRQLVMQFNIDAWMFSDMYPETGLFTIPEKYDWRTLFHKKFTKGVNPIDSEKREQYNTGMLEMLAYLKQQGIPGTKIPTKFLFTNAQPAISSYKGGVNQASHVITYIGEYTSHAFRASEYQPMQAIVGFDFTENKTIELGDFLSYLVQDQSDMFYILSPENHNIIKNKLPSLAPYITLWINGKKIDVAQALQNGDIEIQANDMLRLGGSLTMDGFHLYTSPNEQEQHEMTTRLRPLWIHIASGLMYPANIIEPTPELQNIGIGGEYAEILSKIKVRAYISLREGENAKDIINDFLSKENFATVYNALSSEQQKTIDDLYVLQSLAHQLYGNQNFGGTQWNAGTFPTENTFPEESTTFSYKPIQIFDTTHIKEVYDAYIELKKKQYYESLNEEFCEDIRFPFIQIIAFPGDTKYSLMYQVGLQLERVNPELADGFKSLPFIEKEKFIINVLGQEIYDGKIESGKNFFLDLVLIENIITYQNLQSPKAPKLLDREGHESPDQKIIQTIAEDQSEAYMLSWALLIESYVDACEGCDDFDKTYVWNVFKNELLSRRAMKDYVHQAELLGFQDYFDAQGKEFWDQFPPQFIKKLQEIGILDTKYKMVRVTSLGDFQVRVLYNMKSKNTKYLDSWPGKYLEKVIDTILDEHGKYEALLSGYGDYEIEIQEDLKILISIKEILKTDIKRTKAGEIEELIREISFLDTGNQENIVGKIFWGELLRYKNKEHSENLFQQLQVSKQEIANINNLSERFMLATQIISNLGEKKSSYLFLENYLQRLIRSLQPDISLPAVKSTEDFMGQTEYDVGIFEEHLGVYKKIIEGIESSYLTPQDKYLLSTAISQIKNSFSKSEDIFKFFASKEISQIYESHGLDPYLLPTITEFDNYDIFRYTAQKKSLAEKRVYKPQFSGNDVVIPLIAGSIITQSFLSMLAAQVGIGFTMTSHIFNALGIFLKKRKKKFIKEYKKNKENYAIGKAKKVLYSSIKKIQTASMDSYLLQNKDRERKKLVLDGESKDYSDGYYKITPKEGIIKREIHANNLVLTNQEGHPLSKEYEDGVYRLLDPITKIIREYNMLKIQALMEQESQKPLLLTPEQRIDKRYSMAAAE